MVGKITLTYFNGQGRAEVARIILNYSGQEFNDVRVSFDKEWPLIKEQQPFKQLPVLEVDGVQIAQARAFELLLAQRFHLVGKNDVEAALNLQYVLAIDDVQANGKSMFYEKDAEKKKELFKVYAAEHVTPFLKLVTQFLAKNGHGHLVGSEISYADISLYQYLWGLINRNGFVIEGAINEFYHKIGNTPKIKKYIESRPKTDF
uniref:Glutathione S-transferase n=1 Tax=Rhabditophanes sp. KR3021 TaxID=114890 RepID=A0AC35U961_9BILA